MRFNIGDRIKCKCCDEVYGTVTAIHIKEKVGYTTYPYTGYSVKNDNDVCGGGETVVTEEEAIAIKEIKA